MSEPTSVYSFYDLLTKISKIAGIAYYGSAGSSRAMPPIDPNELEICRDAVNDGIKMFISDAPPTGWKWMRRIMTLTLAATRVTGTADAADTTSLTDATLEDTYDTNDDLKGWYIYITGGTGEGSFAVITGYTASGGVIAVADWLDEYGNSGGTDPDTDSTFAITPVETVGGDIARYPLPDNFYGSADGDISFVVSTGSGNEIEWTDESTIRDRRSVSVSSGYPQLAALRMLEPASSVLGPKRRMEIIFDPEPSGAYEIGFPYTLLFNRLEAEAGLASSGSDTTLVDNDRNEHDDYFNGWKIKIKDGTGRGSYAIVIDYASGTFTVDDWLKYDGSAGGTNPDGDSTYYVEPVNNLHPAGSRFDEVILSACTYKAAMEWSDVSDDYLSEYTQKTLPQARLIDQRLAPRKLGRDSNIKRKMRYRSFYNVTTEHDL